MTSFKQEENGRQVEYILHEEDKDISVDGIGPSLIGFPLTKISIFQEKLSTDPNCSKRDIVATIQIPTAVILEFAEKMKSALTENIGVIEGVQESVRNMLKK